MFKISAGSWLFWISLIYFIVGIANLLVFHFIQTDILQTVYIVILVLPLVIPPLARKVGVKTLWNL